MLPEHFWRLPGSSPRWYRIRQRRTLPLQAGYRLIGAALFLLSWLSLGVATAAERVALVMVAEDYQKLQKSSVGVKRGNDIADALTARGFDVIFSANPSNSGARASLRDFSAKASTAELAMAVLIGHGSSWGGQSFFLPSNSEIGRATDLLSRGLSITNIAQIVGRAKNGGVFFFMTSPNFSATIEGLDTRPQFTAEIGKNVFAVFSSSAKIPVSRVDSTSEQAAEELSKVLRQSAPMLSDAVTAARGISGMIIGVVADLTLEKPSSAAISPPRVSVAPTIVDQDKKTEADGKREGERMLREAAEKRAREQQAKAEQAQAEVVRAQADIKRVQAEAEAKLENERVAQEAAERQAREQQAQADIKRVQAEAEAKLENERVAQEAAERQAREQQAKAERAQAEVLKAQADVKRVQAEAEAKLENERVAREAAEKRAREQQALAEQAQAETLKARADVGRAQADAENARADTRKAQAEAEKTKSDAKQAEEQDSLTKVQAEPPRPGNNPTAPTDETQAGGTGNYVTGLDPAGDNWLALKAAPNLHSARLMKMPAGTPLKVLRREGAWFNVRLRDGSEGWAEAQYIGRCRNCAPVE
jgi:Bacterial SH3 domain